MPRVPKRRDGRLRHKPRVAARKHLFPTVVCKYLSSREAHLVVKSRRRGPASSRLQPYQVKESKRESVSAPSGHALNIAPPKSRARQPSSRLASEVCGHLTVSSASLKLTPQSTGANSCAAFRGVAAWWWRRTVRTLRLATATSARSRILGTRPSRARELALVAACPSADASNRAQRAVANRSQSRTLPAGLLDTRCQANFELTYSKQRKDALARCHRFRGSVLEAKSEWRRTSATNSWSRRGRK